MSDTLDTLENITYDELNEATPPPSRAPSPRMNWCCLQRSPVM